MNAYLLLIRGINVGGKNKVLMLNLKERLYELGYKDVTSYIASGNVILRSNKKPAEIRLQIENMLPMNFELDSKLVKVLVLSYSQLKAAITNKPKGFGEQANKYRSDAIFLIDIATADAMRVFNPREGVDKVWAGDGVIYFQRLDALRTKSRLSGIIGTPEYKSMTIRSWNTVTKLMEMLEGTTGQASIK